MSPLRVNSNNFHHPVTLSNIFVYDQSIGPAKLMTIITPSCTLCDLLITNGVQVMLYM